MEIKKLSDDVKTSLRSAFTINSIPQCVNELVLNSLDAKSTLIAVRINLHTFRLQVVDNGNGIDQQNLDFIGKRYYTTKCHTFREYKNNSKYYGYKGETLASIIDTCKKLLISTRCPESKTTFCKTCENKSSTIIEVKDRPSAGTTVTVEDFMFNLPVRQGRVNIDLDLNEIKHNLEMLSIMNPEVSFSLRNDINKKTLYKTDKADSVEKALITVYKEIEPNFLSHIKIKHGKISVAALIYKKILAKHQIIYVNKRYVHCENLQNHINKILQKSSISKDSNCNFVYVVNIRCPYSQVDLTNTNKVTVEFRNWEMILKIMDKLLMKFLEKEHLEVPYEKTPQMVEVAQTQLRLSNMKGMCKATAVKRKIARNCEIISRSVSEVRSIKVTCSNKKIKLCEEVVDEKISKKEIRENFKQNFDENLKSRKFNKNVLCIKSKKPNLIQGNEREIKLDEVKTSETEDFKKPNRKQTPLNDIEKTTHYNTTFTEFNQRLITIDDVDNQVVGKAIVMDKFLKSLNYCGSRLDKTTTVSMSVKIKSQKRIRDHAENNFYLQSEIFNFTLMENCDKFKANEIFNTNESLLNYSVILKQPKMCEHVNKLDISFTKCEETRSRRLDLNSITFKKRTRFNGDLLNTSFSQLKHFGHGNLPNFENRFDYENNFELIKEQGEKALPYRKKWNALENNFEFNNDLNLNQIRSRKARDNVDLIPHFEYKNNYCLPTRDNLNLNQIEFNVNVKKPYINFEENAEGFIRNKDANNIYTKFKADKPYNPIFGKFIEPGDRDETDLEHHLPNLRNIPSMPISKDNYFWCNRNKNKITENTRNLLYKKMPENYFDANIFNHPGNSIFNREKLHSNLFHDANLLNRNESINPVNFTNLNKFLGYDLNLNKHNPYIKVDNFTTAQHSTEPKTYYNNAIDSFLEDDVRNIYNERETNLGNKRHHLPSDFIFQNKEININCNNDLFRRGVPQRFNEVFNFDNRDNLPNFQMEPKLNSNLFNEFTMRNHGFNRYDNEGAQHQINVNINRKLKRNVEEFKEQNRIFDHDIREKLHIFQTHDSNPNFKSKLLNKGVEEFGMNNRFFDVDETQNLNRNLFNKEAFDIENQNFKHSENVQNLKRNFIVNNRMHPNFDTFEKNVNLNFKQRNDQKLDAQHEVFIFKGNNEINPKCNLFETEVEPFKVKNPIFDNENKTIFPTYQSHSHSNHCNLTFSMPTNERLMNVEEVQCNYNNFDFINNTQIVKGIPNIQFPTDKLVGEAEYPKIVKNNPQMRTHLVDSPLSKPIRKAVKPPKTNRYVKNQITQTGKSLKLQQEIAIKNVLERRKSFKVPLLENHMNPKLSKQNSKSQKIVPKVVDNIIHKRKINQKLQQVFNKKEASPNKKTEKKLAGHSYEEDQLNELKGQLDLTETKRKLKKKCKEKKLSPLIKPGKVSKPMTDIIKSSKFKRDQLKENNTSKKGDIKVSSEIHIFPNCIVKENADADSSMSRISETPEMKSFANLNLENSNSSRSLLLADSECNENKTSESILEMPEKTMNQQNLIHAKKLKQVGLQETSKSATCKEHSGLAKQSFNNEKFFELNAATEVPKSAAFKENLGLSKQPFNRSFNLNDASKATKMDDGVIFDKKDLRKLPAYKNKDVRLKSKTPKKDFWQPPDVTKATSSQKSVHGKSQNLGNLTFQKLCDKSPLLKEDEQRNTKYESDTANCEKPLANCQNAKKKSSLSQKLCEISFDKIIDKSLILDNGDFTKTSQKRSLDFWGNHKSSNESNQKSPVKTQKLCNHTIYDATPLKKTDYSNRSNLKSEKNSLDLLNTNKSKKLDKSTSDKKNESQKKSFDFLNMIRSSQKLHNRTFEKISDKSPLDKGNSLDFLDIDKSSNQINSDKTKLTDKVEESCLNPNSFCLDIPSNSKIYKSSQDLKPSSKTQKLCDITFQKLSSFDLFDDVKTNVSKKDMDGNKFQNISDVVDLDSFNFIKRQDNKEMCKNIGNISQFSINPSDKSLVEEQTEQNKHTSQKHKMTKSEILEFENGDIFGTQHNSNPVRTNSKSQSHKISSELMISLSEKEKNKLLENELNKGKVSEGSNNQNNNEWVLSTDPDGNKLYVNLRSGMTMLQNFNDTSNFKVKERLEFVPKGLSPILSGSPIKKVALSLSGKMKLYKAIAESYKNELETIKWQQILNNKDPKAFFNEIYKKCHKKSNLEMLNVHKGPYFKTSKTLNFNVFTNKIFDDIHVIGQWDKKFIVTLGKSKTLLLLFDQHAVHERIRVEKLYSEYTTQEENNVQYKRSALKFKIKLNLGITESNILSTYKLVFEKYGLKYEVDDNHNIVQIKEIPTCLLNKTKNDKHHEKLKELVVALIEEEIDIIQTTKGAVCKESNLIRDIINSEACRGAVMFGDILTLDECKNLIKDLSLCNLPFQCAHGRPTLAPIIDLRSTENVVRKVNIKNLK